MQEIPVLIRIESQAAQTGESPETISMDAPGIYIVQDKRAELHYMEAVDPSMAQQNVTLILEDEALIMHREGDYSADMVFREGCRYEGVYETPVGDMDMGIFCNTLRWKMTSDYLNVFISYQLDLNGQFAAEHEMHIYARREI